MSIEAMKMALEALEDLHEMDIVGIDYQQQMQGLRQAIEQVEKDDMYKNPDTGNPCEGWDTSDMAHRSGGLSVEQEPVAWVDKVWVERLDISKQLRMELLFSRCQLNNNQIPLYTAPIKRPVKSYTGGEPQYATDAPKHEDDDIQEYKKPWVGLTKEEIVSAYCSIHAKEWAIGGMDDVLPFTRAIEAKLKEKNGG
jgi:hypothetical protein